MTGARGTGPVSPRDITGRRDRELRAQVKANREAAKLTADELAQKMHTARTEGHKAGFTEGFRSGWNMLANLLVDAGLVTEDQVLDVANATEGVA